MIIKKQAKWWLLITSIGRLFKRFYSSRIIILIVCLLGFTTYTTYAQKEKKPKKEKQKYDWWATDTIYRAKKNRKNLDSIYQDTTVYQRRRKPVKYRELGMNLTPLIGQIAPFNRSAIRSGPFGIVYQKVRENGRLFRFGIGADFDFEEEEFNHFNARIGWGKQRSIGKRFYIQTGIDIMGGAGGFNIPGSSNQAQAGSFGLAPFVGVSFDIVPDKLSISTESQLFMGPAAFVPFIIQVIPPVGLFINVKIPKKKREQ